MEKVINYSAADIWHKCTLNTHAKTQGTKRDFFTIVVLQTGGEIVNLRNKRIESVFACLHAWHVQPHACMHMHTHKHVHTCTHTNTHAHTHTRTHIWLVHIDLSVSHMDPKHLIHTWPCNVAETSKNVYVLVNYAGFDRVQQSFTKSFLSMRTTFFRDLFKRHKEKN